MKSVQKFTTFDELKRSDNKTLKEETYGLKKHSEFEKVIMDIRSVKIKQNKLTKPEQ